MTAADASVSRNSLIYAVSNLLGHAYVFATMPVLTRCLSAEEFGFYIVLTQIATLIQTLGHTLFSNAMMRLYYEYDGAAQRRFVGTVLISAAAFQTALAGGVYLYRHRLIAGLFPNVTLPLDPVMLWAAVWAVVRPVRQLLRVLCKAQERPWPTLLQSGGYGLLLIGLLLLLVGDGQGGLVGALQAMVLAELLTQIWLTYYLRRDISLVWDLATMKRCVLFSLPLLASSSVFVLFSNIDRIILSRYVSLAELGVYGLGLTIGAIGGLAVTSYQSSYSPRLIRVYIKGDRATVGPLMSGFIRENLYFMGFSFGALSIGSDLLVAILGKGQAFSAAALVATGIVSWHFLRSLYLFGQDSLFYLKRTTAIFLLNALWLIVAIGVMHLMAAHIGAHGMAFANSAVYLLAVPVAGVIVRRSFGAKLPVSALLITLAAVSMIIIAEGLLEHWKRPVDEPVFWLTKAVELAILAVVFGPQMFSLFSRAIGRGKD